MGAGSLREVGEEGVEHCAIWNGAGTRKAWYRKGEVWTPHTSPPCPPNQPRSQGLLSIQKRSSEKTLANSGLHVHKLPNLKARYHFKTIKIPNIFGDTWPPVCQGLLRAAILYAEKTMGTRFRPNIPLVCMLHLRYLSRRSLLFYPPPIIFCKDWQEIDCTIYHCFTQAMSLIP